MKHGSDDMPIACCLTSAELRERVATLLAKFRSAVIKTEELPDGYAFRVSGDRKWVAIVAKMIVAERECCPWTRWRQRLLENCLVYTQCVYLAGVGNSGVVRLLAQHRDRSTH